jgi:deoxycytidine triphosphate deaminase
MRRALDIISLYPAWVRQFAEREAQRTADDTALIYLLGLLCIEVVFKTEFVEDWFAEASALNVPLSLINACERECRTLNLGDRHAVLAIGPAYNFYTLDKELSDYLFGNQAITQPRPTNLPPDLFAMVQVPRLEGGEGLWWPLVLGHELAHLAASHDSTVAKLNLASRIHWKQYSVPAKDQAGFLEMAESWVLELICDAYCVYRFGPAGAASIVDVLDNLGGAERASATHPPHWLRFRLVRSWAGDVHGSLMASILDHCNEICNQPMPVLDPDMMRLITLLESLSGDYLAAVQRWSGQQFITVAREESVLAALRDLDRGIPPRASQPGAPLEVKEEDAINAGWVAWTRGIKWPLGKLLRKSLDSLAFLREWTEAGGKTGISADQEPPAREPTVLLSGPSIVDRVGRGSEDDRALVVTPLLPFAIGRGSLDVRLGPQFIVFQRTDTASIKTFDPTWDPREVQRLIEVGWGERFVLHPNELVLASTLEYFALPKDLSAQVITRSAYGRMGLITATAVQVHPHFHGCLTLELLNLGLVPLELMPGERIAQLIFIRVDPPPPPPKVEDHECPVGPEFSRPFKEGDESRVFLKILERAQNRRGSGRP